jgi:hypothetical protein
VDDRDHQLLFRFTGMLTDLIITVGTVLLTSDTGKKLGNASQRTVDLTATSLLLRGL